MTRAKSYRHELINILNEVYPDMRTKTWKRHTRAITRDVLLWFDSLGLTRKGKHNRRSLTVGLDEASNIIMETATEPPAPKTKQRRSDADGSHIARNLHKKHGALRWGVLECPGGLYTPGRARLGTQELRDMTALGCVPRGLLLRSNGKRRGGHAVTIMFYDEQWWLFNESGGIHRRYTL